MIEDYNVYILKRNETLPFYALTGTSLGFTAYLFYGNIYVSLIFAMLAWPAKRIYSNHLAERRKDELRIQFRDLLYSISSYISTGRQMRGALIEAAKDMKLTYGEHSLISAELGHMVLSMEESGETEVAVLKCFADRSGVEDIVDFVDVYCISKKTGGDMGKAIRKTVEILLDRIEMDRQVKTLIAQKRLEFIILTAMPILVLLFLKLTSASYLNVMYQFALGRICMSIALLFIGIASYMAYRITQIRL